MVGRSKSLSTTIGSLNMTLDILFGLRPLENDGTREFNVLCDDGGRHLSLISISSTLLLRPPFKFSDALIESSI